LPLLLVVPFASASVALAGQRAGWYGESVAFALFTLLAMAALAALGAVERPPRRRSGPRAGASREPVPAAPSTTPRSVWRIWTAKAAGYASTTAPARSSAGRARSCSAQDAREITHDEDRGLDALVRDGFLRGEIDGQHLEKRFRDEDAALSSGRTSSSPVSARRAARSPTTSP
jgi:hypothetical protein